MTSRERGLLTALVGVGILLVLLLGVKLYKENVDALTAERDQLLAKKMRYETSPAADQELSEEKKWISENEPEPQEVSKAAISIRQTAQDLVSRNGVTTSSIEVQNNEDGEGGEYVPIRVEIKGKDSQAKIMNLLIALHQPHQFRAVTDLSILNTATDDVLDFVILVEQKVVDKVTQ